MKKQKSVVSNPGCEAGSRPMSLVAADVSPRTIFPGVITAHRRCSAPGTRIVSLLPHGISSAAAAREATQRVVTLPAGNRQDIFFRKICASVRVEDPLVRVDAH